MQIQVYELHQRTGSSSSLVKLCLLNDKQEFYKIDIDSYKKSDSKSEMNETDGLLSEGLKMLEIKFDDFIGVEVKENEIIFHTTDFGKGGWCSKPSKDFRKIVSHSFSSDGLEFTKIRDNVLESFSTFCKKEYNSGKIEHVNNFCDSTGLKSYEKRLLILINPVGGKGKAVQIYEGIERYILSMGFVPTIIKTTHYQHVIELIRDMKKEELNKYYALVTVAGDGIGHEIVNGFYARKDYKELTIRMGFQHGGSACGVACSVTKEWGLGHDQTNCLYVLARCRFKSITVTKYDINDEKNPTVYGILGYFFGYTCDVDFNSEFLRCFGGLRLQLYAYPKILNLPKRNCNIWLSEETIPDDQSIDSQINNETMTWKLYSGPTYNFLFQTIPLPALVTSITRKIAFSDEYALGWVSPVSKGFFHFVKEMLAQESQRVDEIETAEVFKGKSFRLELVENSSFNKKNTPINIDGEKYYGTKIQGTLVNDRRAFLIC